MIVFLGNLYYKKTQWFTSDFPALRINILYFGASILIAADTPNCRQDVQWRPPSPTYPGPWLVAFPTKTGPIAKESRPTDIWYPNIVFNVRHTLLFECDMSALTTWMRQTFKSPSRLDIANCLFGFWSPVRSGDTFSGVFIFRTHDVAVTCRAGKTFPQLCARRPDANTQHSQKWFMCTPFGPNSFLINHILWPTRVANTSGTLFSKRANSRGTKQIPVKMYNGPSVLCSDFSWKYSKSKENPRAKFLIVKAKWKLLRHKVWANENLICKSCMQSFHDYSWNR